MRRRKTARPSNLPGTGKGHGRKAKPGPCARCGTVGLLLKRLCRRCYQHEYRKHERCALLKAKKDNQPSEGSPSWVEDWLRQQAENYLRENAGYFERNGTRLWAVTEEQIIGLCRLIYLAQRHHNDKRGYQPHDNYARREKLREEGDGHYLDRHVMPEIKRWTK